MKKLYIYAHYTIEIGYLRNTKELLAPKSKLVSSNIDLEASKSGLGDDITFNYNRQDRKKRKVPSGNWYKEIYFVG